MSKSKKMRVAPIVSATSLVLWSALVSGQTNRITPIDGQASVPTLGTTHVQGYYGPDVADSDTVHVQAFYGSDQLPVAGTVQANPGRAHLDHPAIFATNSKTTSNDPCAKDPSGGANNPGRPIQVNTGSKYETYPLFQLPGEMGLTYTLYYNTSFYGGEWQSNLDYSLDLICSQQDSTNCAQVTYYRPDGSSLIFAGAPGKGPYTERGGNGLATLTYDPSSLTYTLHDEDAKTLTFSPYVAGEGAILSSISDAAGIGWKISFQSQSNGTISTIVTHTNGKYFVISPGPNTETLVNGKYISSYTETITDPAGNNYTIHDTEAEYDQITYPGSPATTVSFKYQPTNKLAEVDYNGTPYDLTTYITDATSPFYNWANANYLADNSSGVYISYSKDSKGNLQAVLTNSLGHQTVQTYDGTNDVNGPSNGYLSLISDQAVTTCGATTHGRSYDANGYLSEVLDNNGHIHTYHYASNGQLQSETEGYGTAEARTTDYVWDPVQQLNRLLSVTVEGWQRTSYTYDAHNRLSSESVTNLSANGSANQTLTTAYSYVLYGNGMVQTMVVTKPSANGSNKDTYNYDSLGNLVSFTNGLGQTTSYSNYNGLGEVGHVVGPNGDTTDFTYDARGRIATKTTHPNGGAATWTYAYDGFGLLYTLSGPDGQVTTWNRDAVMRVSTITHNDKDGTSTESFNYDANGDVLEHKVARGNTVGLDEIFHYDALGRIYQKVGQNGQTLTYAYDGNGNTLSTTNAVGHSIVYQYDALNRVISTTESGGGSPAMPSSAPTLNAPASSTSGAYTVSWNSMTGATYYVLQEKVGGAGWNTVRSSAAISWSATGKATNSYSYQAKACNSTGCGPWSGTSTVSVAIPTAPTSAPALSVPASSANGSYTVSWTQVSNTSTYILQEQANGGAWNTIQNSAATGWSVNGRTNGTYVYRVQACNAIGCGPFSNSGTMAVTWPPTPGTPTISVPAYSYNGSYSVSWNAVANATSYPLYQSVNGGGWTLVQNNGATNWSVGGEGNGTYAYLVSACNISGCSAQSGGTTTVTIPSPIAINGQQYWGSIVATTSLARSEGIGFDIANGNTWEVFHTTLSDSHAVMASGALPYGAVSVQYTWTDLGAPSGYTAAAGSITVNGASTPTAVSSNPATRYVTSAYRAGDHAHQYSLRVDFFNAAGANVSSSTCTLVGEVVTNQ